MRSRSPAGAPQPMANVSVRGRSPVDMRRGRDISPGVSRQLRSPPPAKRERFVSPPRGRFDAPRSPHQRTFSPPPDNRYPATAGPKVIRRQRSPSPPRREPLYAQPASREWKARSPSPGPRRSRQEQQSEQSSPKLSGNVSRQFSPPVHPSRLALQHPEEFEEDHHDSPGWTIEARRAPVRSHAELAVDSPPPRSAYRERSPMDVERPARWNGERSPAVRTYSPGPPTRMAVEYRSPPRRREFSPRHEDQTEYYESRSHPRHGPPHHSGYRNGYAQGPSRGPPGNSSRHFNSGPPPSGPSGPPISMSAHNRPGNMSVLAAPSHPRGGSGPPPRREHSYPGYRGGRSAPYPLPMHTRGHYHPRDRSPGSGGRGGDGPGVPTGPRTPHSHSHSHAPPQFRPPPPHHSHNSTSRTYPLTQRFSRHLSDLPSIVPGGKASASNVGQSVKEKLARLEQDQKRLEAELADKLDKKRAGMRTWDRLERETTRESLKSELAEQQVRVMSGEGGMGGAAF